MSTNNNSGGGVGLATLLFVLFLGLKLGNVISWSWWWVFSPLWISFVFYVCVLAVLMVFASRSYSRAIGRK